MNNIEILFFISQEIRYTCIPVASGLEIILTIPVDGDESTIHQAVDAINREFFFRELIAEDFHMEVVNN